MSYMALYRKWRPLVFSDVVEQTYVVKALKNSIMAGKIAHAYLFCGTRGTGKTTLARIFSRAVNCTSSLDGDPCNSCESCKQILSKNTLDIIEIDAASNNGVDNIRDIRESTIYTPSFSKYKIYIIDEVHMLSTGAFNALLKVLEEPPPHVIFILATTDPYKLPATILSRCQRFDFKRISSSSIANRLRIIAKESGSEVAPEALKLIANVSEGALRDAISILDQCVCLGGNNVSYDDVIHIVGVADTNVIANLVDAVGKKDIKEILDLVNKLVEDGKEISNLVSSIISYYRALLIYSFDKSDDHLIGFSDIVIDKIKKQAESIDAQFLILAIKELCSLESLLKWSSYHRVMLEVALIRLCEEITTDHIVAGTNYNDDINQKITTLENKIKSLENVILSQPISHPGQKSKPFASPKNIAIKNNNLSEISREDVSKAVNLNMWPSILQQLKDDGRVSLYINLLNTKLIKISNSLVGIIFDCENSFNYYFISRLENLELIKNLIIGVIGEELDVRCYILKSQGENKASTSEVNKECDNLLKKAKMLSDNLNIDLNVIDE